MLYTGLWALGTLQRLNGQTLFVPDFVRNCLEGTKAGPKKFLTQSLVHIASEEQHYTW